MNKNYYKILEVDSSASPEVIEKAYKTLAKKYHPDLQEESQKESAGEKLKEINSDLYLFSYELLSKLKENLKSVGLDELTIKNLIIKSPIIILFSDKLDNVFFLYKADKFYGYTILVNNEYMTYMFNNNVQSNVITNNTMIDMMLSSVADAKKQEQLKVYFKHLERNYSLKNFYFKTIKDSKKDR